VSTNGSLECRACRRRRTRTVFVVAVAGALAIATGAFAAGILFVGPNFGIVGTCGEVRRGVTRGESACDADCESGPLENRADCFSHCWTEAAKTRAREDAESNASCEFQTRLAEARFPLAFIASFVFAVLAFVFRGRIRDVVRWRDAAQPYRDRFACPEHGEMSRLPKRS
jgi:hypothetical protein